MKTGLAVFIICAVSFGVYYAYLKTDNPLREAAAQSQTTTQANETGELTIQIYPAPKAFRQGYVAILSQMITSKDEVRYPQSKATDTLISDATDSSEETDAGQTESPVEYVQYDPEKKILVVLADPIEHQKIERFLNQLNNTQPQTIPVLYRLAFVERSIHPKLKNYPFEFKINGKSWRDGITKNKYPVWLVDYHKHFPGILFTEVDINRKDDHSEFELEGFARTQAEYQQIKERVEAAHHTDSDIKLLEHDFMAESRKNLSGILSEIFPQSKIEPVMQSLQHTEVFQVEAEATLASESSIPGFFKTALGDEYFVAVQNHDGLEPDGKFRAEIHIYKKNKENNQPFDAKNLHLSTSLITEFGQINMLGIRHHEERYVILFSVELVIID